MLACAEKGKQASQILESERKSGKEQEKGCKDQRGKEAQNEKKRIRNVEKSAYAQQRENTVAKKARERAVRTLTTTLYIVSCSFCIVARETMENFDTLYFVCSKLY